jgi:hypothetical protein
VRLETVNDCDGNQRVVVGGVTADRRRRLEGDGVLDRGLGMVALLLLFLAKVSTKLDLMDRATEESVARRRRVQSAGVVGRVRPLDGVNRSALRCSIVVNEVLAVVVKYLARLNLVAGS